MTVGQIGVCLVPRLASPPLVLTKNEAHIVSDVTFMNQKTFGNNYTNKDGASCLFLQNDRSCSLLIYSCVLLHTLGKELITPASFGEHIRTTL